VTFAQTTPQPQPQLQQPASSLLRTAGALSLALLSFWVLSALQGCAMYDPRIRIDSPLPVMPDAAPAVLANTGSIYQASTYRPLFEDHRARLVGDTLTVAIIEKVSATQKSTSSVDKSGSLTAGIIALPGIKAAALAKAGAEGSTANTFAGKGSTESSNDFSGTITVVVRRVLPNGHLLIAGEKQIGVNQNVDVLRFSGQVDPRAIQAGNTVQSAQIANVRLEQRGRGQQAEAQAVGWLSRIFLNVLPI
jgi:flagellar L-ring protein precursor FlgH